MEKSKNKKPTQGEYILVALRHHFLNGDSYIMADELYGICKEERKSLAHQAFERDYAFLMREGKLHREGRRLYLTGTWAQEEDAAKRLAELLANNNLAAPPIPEELTVNGLTLLPEQHDAVGMALSHRLSTILGGAGCGKTTLIRAIAQYGRKGVLVCAPTGKAAQNLRERTGLAARTVHSALGMGYQDDDAPLPPVRWPYVQTIIIDEASMLSLCLLDGVLRKVPDTCSIVLVGDPKQLLSVGSGNILPDLLELGIPSICLQTNHRQAEGATGLQHNVVEFNHIEGLDQLAVDDSFVLKSVEDAHQAVVSVAKQAVQMLGEGQSFQVLASRNATVDVLNRIIQRAWNPAHEGVQTITYKGKTFRHGDKVIITKNDSRRRCWNGDIGTLIIKKGDEMTKVPAEYQYAVMLPDGRCPKWFGAGSLEHLELAYAITVHKAQGSEFDFILMPLTMDADRMLHRNLLYTAASRARRRVTICGSPNAVDVALHSLPPRRRSMLVTKTRMRMMLPQMGGLHAAV